MRLLHSADWHLGKALFGKKRDTEHEAFLRWLTGEVKREQVDVLLIAGDVFDTTAPPHRAQELYYQFLVGLQATSVRHVVVVGGNHDSAAFLEAPGPLLKILNIHVTALYTEPANEVLVLSDPEGVPEAVVGTVPYLRERDLRWQESGETINEKEERLKAAVAEHYAQVVRAAQQARLAAEQKSQREIPLILTGHLFTSGGVTAEGDGVRELYVGTLGHVGPAIFTGADYTALGHLHVPQEVGSPLVRYSGSPLPMGFGEADQQKSVCLVNFEGRSAQVSLLVVPTFQKLQSLRGDLPTLLTALTELRLTGEAVWLELLYDGLEATGTLREDLERAAGSLAEGSPLEILRVRNLGLTKRVLQDSPEISLDDLTPTEVFERCLEANQTPEPQRVVLRGLYQEILSTVEEPL